MAVLCDTMQLQPYGIMRLAGPAFFRFLFSQIQPTPYGFRKSDGRQYPWVVVAMAPSHLPTCDLITCHPTYVPIQHQLQSRSATTHCLHIICGTVRVKSKYASVCFCRSLRGASQHRSWGWIWGHQGRRPVGSRWEEVLYTARLKHLVHVRIMCRLKTLRPGSC